MATYLRRLACSLAFAAVGAACTASAPTAPRTEAPAPILSTTATATPVPVPVPVTPDATATAGPTPTATRGPTFEADVPFTPPIACAADPAWEDAICELQYDIAAPPAGTGTHPVAVLLRGGPEKPHAIDYLADTARALADRGVVAMVADWRESADYAGGGRTSLEDVACAIGVARRIAPAYGGDPSRLTVAGHSFGGWSGGIVGLGGEGHPPGEGQCLETAGALKADAFVSLDGSGLDGSLDDVVAAAARHPKDPPPILVVNAEADPVVPVRVARDFATAMGKAGYHPELLVIPGGDHMSALYDDEVLDAIARIAGA